MPKILISRKDEWMNRFREIDIYLDSKKIGSIANSQVKTFDIPAGEHSLSSKIDWCSSPQIQFDIRDENELSFELESFKFGRYLFFLSLIFDAIFFALLLILDIDSLYFFILVFPLFFYMFYYLTIGRNKYLRLSQL